MLIVLQASASELDFVDPPDTIFGPLMVCEDVDSAIYSIDTVDAAVSYSWAVPTGWTIVSGDGTTSIIVEPGAAGDNGMISVSALDTSGSSSAYSLAVSVNPLPIVYAGEDTSLCSSQFPYTFIGSGNATSYNWSGNPPSLTVPVWATAVLIGELNGCTNSDTVTIHIAFCGGVEENTFIFYVSPNPATENIAISCLSLNANEAYTIYGNDGRVIANGILDNNNPTIPIVSIPPGSYFIRLGTSMVPFEIVR